MGWQGEALMPGRASGDLCVDASPLTCGGHRGERFGARLRAFAFFTILIGLLALQAIDAPADVPLSNPDCWSCHHGYYHVAQGTEFIDCYTSGCHPSGEWGAPGDVSFEDVDSAHGTNAGVEQYYDCTFCHNSSYPAVLQHTAAGLVTAHETTVGFDGCGDCHSPALIPEHNDDCGMCHSSADPQVEAAIDDWDKSCDACHDVAVAHDAFHDAGLVSYAGEGCDNCHADNISVEHADDCAMCHASTDPDVEQAIAADQVSCGACHDLSVTHLEMHESGAVNQTCVGSGCHQANLVPVHGDCGMCHASTDPDVIAAIEGGGLACGPCHSTAHFTWSSPTPYRNWDDAVAAMESDGIEPGTPHGGYTATTVKCAVCHSVHRAASPQTAAGVGAYWKLTPGGQSCVACHTATGANPSDLVVEWPSVYTDGGPHMSFNCMGQCHAGVHGALVSDYESAAKFLLNPNVNPATTNGFGLDEGLAGAISTGNLGGGVTLANLDTWPTATEDQQGVRAMVTGYLCAQAGCHTASQFAVNTHGYAGARTLPADAANGPYDQFYTGHNTGSATDSCASSGCHAVADDGDDAGDSKCATCHDFKGVVTGSSAWPHANRGIDVYEWVRPMGTLEVTETPVIAGNLWMYTGDVTWRDTSGEPTATPLWDGVAMEATVTVQGYRSDRINTRTVLQGNSSFDLVAGNPGNIRDGVCLKCHGFKYWPHWDDDDHESFSDY